MGQFSMVIYTPPGSHLSGNQQYNDPVPGQNFKAVGITDGFDDGET